MDQQEYRAAIEDVIYMTRCAVNGVAPDPVRVGNMDLSRLYHAADSHMMTSVVAMALDVAGVEDEAFRQAEAKAIRKNAALDAELSCLSQKLEQLGIWHMPLKGAVMKDYYPRFGMRQMADYDILFDADFDPQVRSLMKEMGYTVKDCGVRYHDLYIKPPIYVFEMHRRLFDSPKGSLWHTYYADVKTRLIPDAEAPCRYYFSPEDFYIYMTAHEHKHYVGAGNGLRSNLDVYVYCLQFGATLNWNYISAELEKLGLTVFEKHSRELALALFGDGAMTDGAKELYENHLLTGTYGNERNRVEQCVKRLGGGRRGLWRYILERLFIPKETIQEKFPFFWKHKMLLPFLIPFRIIRCAILHWSRISVEMKTLFRLR